jgi:hypothetical protein
MRQGEDSLSVSKAFFVLGFSQIKAGLSHLSTEQMIAGLG